MPEVLVHLIEVKVVRVKIEPAVEKARDELAAKGFCIGCERKLDGKQPRRGLCPACYQAATRAMQAKKISKSQLVREGKMFEDRRQGRKAENKFTRQLAEL